MVIEINDPNIKQLYEKVKMSKEIYFNKNREKVLSFIRIFIFKLNTSKFSSNETNKTIKSQS